MRSALTRSFTTLAVRMPLAATRASSQSRLRPPAPIARPASTPTSLIRSKCEVEEGAFGAVGSLEACDLAINAVDYGVCVDEQPSHVWGPGREG